MKAEEINNLIGKTAKIDLEYDEKLESGFPDTGQCIGLLLSHAYKLETAVSELKQEVERLGSDETNKCDHRHIRYINSEWGYFCLVCGKSQLTGNHSHNQSK